MPVVLFVVLVLGSMWCVSFGLYMNPQWAIYFPFVMLMPAGIAIAINRYYTGSFAFLSELFLTLPGYRAWLFSTVYPLAVIGLIAVFGYVLGGVTVAQEQWVNLLYQPTLWGVVLACVLLFGEEYGWRGFLLHQLIFRIGPCQATVVTGLVWALWHLPLVYVLATLSGVEHPLWLMLIQGLAVFLFSFVFAHAYLLAYSIWPPVLLHYIWNVYNPIVLGNIYQNEPGIMVGNMLWINGEAFAGIVVGLPFMVWFFYRYCTIKWRK